MVAKASSADHLVIGGGLAGSLVGLRLAQAGREVTLLEREKTAHHKVCGEFLSREAVGYLTQAGIDPVALGAQTIHSVRLTSKSSRVEAALPFSALSLSRCVLDEALLARAVAAGCNVLRGTAVEFIDHQDGAWHAQLRDGDSWRSPTVFLASGKHDLRRLDRKPGPHGDMVGFKLHWRLMPDQTRPLMGYMELFLFAGGYGGLSLVEDNTSNLCLVVRRSVLRRHGGWTELLASIRKENQHLEGRLCGGLPLWDKPLAISSIPYGYLEGRPQGLWCVGDQAAVIPSFTGDGMSIALHSASLAAEFSLAGRSADDFHRRLCDDLRGSMRLATALSRTMVHPIGRAVAPIALSLFPASMNWIAALTRIPERALLPIASADPHRTPVAP